MVSATNGTSIRKCDAVPEPLVRPFTPLVHSTLFVFIQRYLASLRQWMLYRQDVMQLLFRKSQSYLASLLFKTRLSLQGLASRPSVPGWPPETGTLGCENDAPRNHLPSTLIFILDLNLGLNQFQLCVISGLGH